MMRLFVIHFFTLFFSLHLFGQANTDLHLFNLGVNQREVKFDNHRQVTQQIGYENQAHFLLNGESFYYASVNESGQTDIYQYGIREKKSRQLTRTFLSSEYSPTPTPDGLYISCIRQGADGSQNLVKYPASGGTAIVLIDNHLIGYHIWLDKNRVLTFVLNESTNDMYLHDLSTGVERKLAENIGRCFKHIPNRSAISYIQLNSEGFSEIKSLDMQTLKTTSITKSFNKIQDYEWLSENQIILAKDSKIYSWSPGQEWLEISDLSRYGLKGITRIAVNPDRDKIVLVSEE